MHWRLLASHACLLLLGSSLLGCKSADPPPAAMAAVPAVEAAPAAEGARAAMAPPPASWPRYVVAMQKVTDCEPINGWIGEPLAPPSAPPSLRRFCSYQWTGPGPHPGGPPSFPDGAPLLGPDPERPIVLPQLGSLHGDELHDKQNERLLVELGGVPNILSHVPRPRNPLPPHVAIIDTVAQRPTSQPPTSVAAGSMEHGLAMDAIIRAIACPPDARTCVGKRWFVAALEDDPSTAIQDAIGSPFMLAQAIVTAVQRWDQPGQTDPLILNLSLGWDWSPLETTLLLQEGTRFRHLEPEPRKVDMPSDDASAEVHAVVAALAWASCKGALAIAASGNVQGRSCSTNEDGPTAPGAWEAILAPTEDECQKWFGITTETPEQAYAPLVYAVGGIERENEPIGNTRPDSLPPRVLYSAMASLDAHGSASGPWTGTSVATAALSGIAARVWSRHPTDDAHTIMALIDRRGEVLESLGPASVVLTGQRRDVRRLWAHAYEPAGPNDPPSDFMVSPAPVESFKAIDVAQALTGTGITVGHARPSALINRPLPMTTTTIKHPGCYDREVKRHGRAPSSLQRLPQPDPAFRPQPDVPICPTCPLVADGRGGYDLTIDIDDEFEHATIGAAAILEITEGRTIHELYIDLSSCNFTSQSKPSCRLSLGGFQLSGTTPARFEDYLAANQSSIFSGRLLFSVRTATSQEQLLGNEIEVFH